MYSITTSNNNCINCNRNVRSCYYIFDKSLCNVCDKILKGGTKECKVCKETKDICLFERPYLTRCKHCSLILFKEHYERNKENYINCSCVKSVRFCNISQHLKTKYHLAVTS